MKSIKIDQYTELPRIITDSSNEIDILAYNLKERNFLVGEVKWTSRPLDIEIVEELVRKSKTIINIIAKAISIILLGNV